MEEKFSVSLELIIQKFKDNAKKVQEVAKNVGNKIKENMSVPVGGSGFENISAEAELLLNKINDIKATLEMAKTDTFLSKQDILELRIELEKLENRYNKINKSNSMFNNSLNRVQEVMGKSLHKIKRYTMSLFGIWSIYRAINRASSAYASIDEESSMKTQSAWIGLGSIFAWLKDIIADFAIKAVSYINVFIKALTGVDFLAKAMKKSMDKASKSAGKLSKVLAGFDEITNLDDSANGINLDTSWIDAFKNVELDQKVVKWLQNIAGWLKENKELLLSIVGIFAGAVVVSKLANILSIFTSIQGLGMTFLFIGIATAIDGVIKYLNDQTWKNFLQTLGGISLAISGLILLISGPAGWTVALGGLIIGIGSLIGSMIMQESKSEQLRKANERLKKSEEDLKEAKDNLRRATDDYIYAVDRAEQTANDLEEAEKRLGISGAELQKQVDEGTLSYKEMDSAQREVYKKYRDYINAQEELKTAMQKMNDATKEVNNKTQEVEKNIKRVLETQNYKSAADKFIDWWTGIWKKASNLSKIIAGNFSVSIGTNFGGGGGGGGFAKGLDYVPFEGLYHLHEGETVVPAKFTPELHGLGNKNNNEETNRLLEELIDRIERIELRPYITITDLGQATQKYRVQQARIMGEELI